MPGSSPHTRGAPRLGPVVPARRGIIPAYAGSTGLCNLGPEAQPDHPRIRGEHEPPRGADVGPAGSSPHTRGALDLFKILPLDDGIIPAYAGSTPRRRIARRCVEDHPRIRGEHIDTDRPGATGAGSSPHTRGALSEVRQIAEEARIIPAYAGSTASGPGWSLRFGDHPRIRGEHAAPSESDKWDEGSSPHTRGARSPARSGCS